MSMHVEKVHSAAESGLFWAKNRLKTFKYWKFDNNSNCSPKKMAAAGFIATGGKEEPDLACCFVCDKELNGWEESDDPWEEHKIHCPSCPFVLINKDEKDLTVEDLIDLIHEMQVRRMKTIMAEKLMEFDRLLSV